MKFIYNSIACDLQQPKKKLPGIEQILKCTEKGKTLWHVIRTVVGNIFVSLCSNEEMII